MLVVPVQITLESMLVLTLFSLAPLTLLLLLLMLFVLLNACTSRLSAAAGNAKGEGLLSEAEGPTSGPSALPFELACFALQGGLLCLVGWSALPVELRDLDLQNSLYRP